MKTFKIRTKNTQKTLFSGQFESFKHCLEGAVQQGLQLKDANLKHANLTNANLDDAYLEGADFSFANLTGANLSETRMKHTIWRGASLYNACLAEADLRHADMRFADFGATDFTNADVSNALFSLIDTTKINFFNTRAMRDCVFQDNNNTQHVTSKSPISISGISERPIILVNDFIVIGNTQFKVAELKQIHRQKLRA